MQSFAKLEHKIAPASVTQSTNNYGPNQHPEKLIPKLITNALRGKTLPIYGSTVFSGL